MIYLEPELQKKLFPVFHYSLKHDGILFLGSSESIGQKEELFKIQDKKWKIYSRQHNLTAAHATLNFPIPVSSDDIIGTKTNQAVTRAEELNNFMLVETILQQSGTPPCAVIDEKLDIVYTHGRTGKYLEPAIGKSSMNILEMARPGLKTALATAIRKASTLKHEVIQNAIDIENNGSFITANITVKPVLEFGAIRGMLIVIFNDITKETKQVKPKKTKKNEAIIKLEQELQYTNENLQTTIEELETSNEELKSMNEELQSTNEELQSTNEELETSKEELQSLNEESATVNTELQNRIEELSNANDDMKNFLDSTQIGTIFLDIDLNIRRFNNMIVNLIPLSSMDIGRPVKHFSTELKDFNIVENAQQVLNDLVSREYEVQSQDNNFFRVRIIPYRTTHNVIDGVVITFENITEFKEAILTAERLSVMMNSSDAIIIQDKDGRITFWNCGAQKLYGYTEEKALKMNIKEMVPKAKIPETLAFLENAFKGNLFESMETERITHDNKKIKVWLFATALRDSTDKINGIITIERALMDSSKRIKK